MSLCPVCAVLYLSGSKITFFFQQVPIFLVQYIQLIFLTTLSKSWQKDSMQGQNRNAGTLTVSIFLIKHLLSQNTLHIRVPSSTTGREGGSEELLVIWVDKWKLHQWISQVHFLAFSCVGDTLLGENYLNKSYATLGKCWKIHFLIVGMLSICLSRPNLQNRHYFFAFCSLENAINK